MHVHVGERGREEERRKKISKEGEKGRRQKRGEEEGEGNKGDRQREGEEREVIH